MRTPPTAATVPSPPTLDMSATVNSPDSASASTSQVVSFKFNSASLSVNTGSTNANQISAAIPVSKLDVRRNAEQTPLHIAVVQSILATGSEERMRRVCSNVLVAGGTGLIHNVGFAIESRCGGFALS
jgi:actin-related protein 8